MGSQGQRNTKTRCPEHKCQLSFVFPASCVQLPDPSSHLGKNPLKIDENDLPQSGYSWLITTDEWFLGRILSDGVIPRGFPMLKNPPACAGDRGSIPESGRPPGGGNGSPLQHSCLENPLHRGAWWPTVHGVAKSCTQPSAHTRTCTHRVYGCLRGWGPGGLWALEVPNCLYIV